MLGYCSIHFTVLSLAGLKNIVRYSRDFIIKGFVVSGLHCIDGEDFFFHPRFLMVSVL